MSNQKPINYPSISDYKKALRNAENAKEHFQKLKSKVEPCYRSDTSCEPVFISGNFAVVFKARDIDTGKMVAIRCFHKSKPEIQERHQIITEFLAQQQSPYIVESHYLDKELWVEPKGFKGRDYPVVVMDWVEGETLGVHIKKCLEKKLRYRITSLLCEWIALCRWLLEAGIAHGDLKHDNVMVTGDGALRLVDYDGMFVPGLEGKPGNEKGSPAYQHPKRKNYFGPELDHFSMLVITASFQALIEFPELYERYNE